MTVVANDNMRDPYQSMHMGNVGARTSFLMELNFETVLLVRLTGFLPWKKKHEN